MMRSSVVCFVCLFIYLFVVMSDAWTWCVGEEMAKNDDNDDDEVILKIKKSSSVLLLFESENEKLGWNGNERCDDEKVNMCN